VVVCRRVEMRVVSNICGIVLAAGASSRMGRPKALLELPDGTTLLEHQAASLTAAGCNSVACVLGAEADLIRGIDERLDISWLLNEEWEGGQFTSLQTGLAWMLDDGSVGAIILPVDCVLESPATISSILEAAIVNTHLDALVPEYGERGGHPVYISKGMAAGLIAIDPERPDSRLDTQISMMSQVMRLPVGDAGILRNINTPEEWDKIKSQILNSKS
jgi:molybdenum cofactor cytidylyltransferase